MTSYLAKGNSFLSAYLEQCKTLAKTVVIKSQTSAETLNAHLLALYGESAFDPLDPKTWKYYLNISGEYYFKDEVMRVTSLDTQEVIDFTKANLEIHTSTKEAYAYGTRYYYSLLNQYPNQQQLMLGILYPVDIDKAIAADDGTILGWPADLVEPQEQTLMLELDGHVKRFMHRWNVSAYGLVESLYNAAFLGSLYLTLWPKIMNLRLKRCHTDEAHSFHIREHLASHKALHRYLPYLTLKQSLFFYRNINYLMRHAGSTENFETLVKNILTERRIPMAEYSVRHLNEFDEQFYPAVHARRKPINDEFNTTEISYVQVNELFNKEGPLAYDNSKYYAHNAQDDTLQFKVSPSSVIQTKDLESNMVDYSDALPDPLVRVLMRQWAYMSAHGLYNVMVRFKDPKSGETYTASAQDALIYYQYLFYNSIGVQIVDIPMYMNFKARRNPKPTLQEMLSVVPVFSFKEAPEIAQMILNAQPELTQRFSTRLFFEQSYQIFEQAKAHWYLMGSLGDLEQRGYVNGMVNKLYCDELIVFNTPYTNIADWLQGVNLPVYDFSYEQAQALMSEIFVEATGLVIDDTKILKNIQRFLVEMMMELSSYTIQTIREINDSAVIPLNWPAVRVGNFKNHADHEEWLEMNSRVSVASSVAKETYKLDSRTAIQAMSEIVAPQQVEIVVKSTLMMGAKQITTVELPFKSFQMTAEYAGYDPEISGDASYIGKEFYEALSDEQKLLLKSL